jgi:L-amino acid N-acyltransferase YncA
MPADSELTIRRATRDDLDLVADLYAQLVQDQIARGWRGQPTPAEESRSYIARRLDRADVHYLIASAAGLTVGFVEAALLLPRQPWPLRLLRRLLPPAKPRAAIGYIHNIFVRDEGRRAGVGSSLLTAAINALKAQGIRRLRAHVIAGNEASFALFAKAGLQPSQTAVEGEV